ncbi:MAG: PD-(D/E)XK nuclease family protein [Deltaproteobacteria bacterium]|nr:PD-(D/E)XK nuclease family protein [Deltaproteobacteria bacterium]
MHIVFDLDFDSSCWPGPDGTGAAGETWLGPNGFLERLEVSLGLQGVLPSQIERELSLVPKLEAHGFWSASAKVDSIATAQQLLRWRDHLWECGWRGEATNSPRLQQLSKLTSDVSGGFFDRLALVSLGLRRRNVDIDKVELGTPIQFFSKAWREALDLLSESGVRVRMANFPPAKNLANLGAARRQGFVPTLNDATLQLVRPPGPLAAAELTSAYIASLKSLEGTLIIGGDAVLDEQLRRFALPTTGGSTPGQNSYIQLLTALTELCWEPTSPSSAYELLTHPDGPIPRGLGFKLARALREWPSIESPSFVSTLEDELSRIGDLEYRKKVGGWIRLFFAPATRTKTLTFEQLRPRVEALRSWLQEQLPKKNKRTADLHSALHAIDEFIRSAESCGIQNLSRTELRQILSIAHSSTSNQRRFSAEAGLGAIAVPGGIAAPVDRVIWWNFTESSYVKPRAVPLSKAERESLAAIGVQVPTAGELAQRLAFRYKRPLWRAVRSLILVCPQTSLDGEATHPHPLWDEIAANLEDRSTQARLIHPKPLFETPVLQTRREPLHLPSPRREWFVEPGTITGRKHESASSLESMLGCPLRWTLNYKAGLNSGKRLPLRLDNRLYGAAAHEILASLAENGSLQKDNAGLLAGLLFDKQAPTLAAPLFMAGAHNDLVTERPM